MYACHSCINKLQVYSTGLLGVNVSESNLVDMTELMDIFLDKTQQSMKMYMILRKYRD